MRPAHLGGDAPYIPTPGTPIARATVIDSYQDNASHRWLLRVELDGGKVQTGVQLITEAGGEASGSSARLPARGVAGMVVWPSYQRQAQLCYWLCTLEDYATGLEREDPEDHLSVRADGGAEVRRKDGSVTRRYPGGDTHYDGPEDGSPYIFKLRDRQFVQTATAVTLDSIEVKEAAKPKRVIRLVGVKSLREHRTQLYKDRAEINASEMTGVSELRAERHEPDENPSSHRRASYRGDAAAGRAEVRVDHSGGGDSEAFLLLENDAAQLELRARNSGGTSAYKVNGNNTQVDTDLLSVGRDGTPLAFLASAPPTQTNLELLAKIVEQLVSTVALHEAKLILAPIVDPLLLPIAALPLIPIVPIQLQQVESRNIKAELGGGL